jgi:sugar lactone lactonase YvrE
MNAAGAAPRPDIIIDDTDVYPESMSAAADGTLYIGSMKGIVFRAAPGSTTATAWIRPTSDNGILSILGVLVDAPSNTLWICSAPTPLRNPPVTGISALMAFDLKTGSQKGVYPFPALASMCNDITIAKDGTAYASDTPNGRIFSLSRGAKMLTTFADDPRLKFIDGIVFGGDGTLYANIVTKGLLLRIGMNDDGSVGAITTLTTSAPLAAPDGFRLIGGNRFLLAEGNAGRIDEVTIDGDRAQIDVLKEGLVSPPAVTLVGSTAYALEGRIGYLIDPKLKGQDPGRFKVYAVDMKDQPADPHVTALTAKITALTARVARLDDANQIKKLQRAYGYYLDKGYWQEAADLFAQDASLEAGVDGVYVGKARIGEYLMREGGGNPGPGLPYGQLNHHMQLQPVVHVSADGMTARARWREFALLGRYKQSAAWGDGIYENEYVKQTGVWKIARLHYFPNFVAPYKGGWAALQPADGDWTSATAKAFPPDRPPTVRYQPFPAPYTPPFHYTNPVTGK